MKNKIIYTIIIAFILFFSGILIWKKKPVEDSHKLSLKKASFTDLPGWDKADIKKSLAAFQTSCKAFLKQDPEALVGSKFVHIEAQDWHPACNAALSIDSQSDPELKAFFEKWFTPVEFVNNKPVKGLFTGYYMPSLKGSLKRTDEYNVPLYATPSNLLKANLSSFNKKLKNHSFSASAKKNNRHHFYTRKEINNGAIKKTAKIVAWVKSKIDRSFLEIEGSGVISLPDGGNLYVGYSAENGAPYTAIAKVLIDKGVMTKDNASMQHIRKYLESHPSQIDNVLNKNKSFVFFKAQKLKDALGSQGVPLTPGYSLAIDKKWVPMGAPIWLNTTSPDKKAEKDIKFQRLMVAQDTGGAIKGVVRGDVYWGAGEKATTIAGMMKNKGHYWLLLPHHVIDRLQDKII